MTKATFLIELRKTLVGLPEKDVEERLSFYGEMIDDRMEEGFPEEEAVKSIGTVEEITAQIIKDTPFSRIAKERIKPTRRLEVWELVLLILGAPVWISLAVAALSVIFSLYVSLWAVILSLWAVFAAFVGSAVGCVMAGVVFAFSSNLLVGVATVGCALILAALAIFGFFGCKAATKGSLWLTEKIALWVKRCLLKKEET